MNKDPYKILGVSKNATQEEIKKAYRKLALQYHPDRGGGKETEAKFKEIGAAYEILSNPEKRSRYDQFGQAGFTGNDGNGFQDFNFRGFGDFSNFGGFGGLGNIFEDLFGQTFSQVQAEIQISPAQAVLGDHIKINIDHQELEFDIPSGTQAGTTFRVSGRGRTYQSGKRGDLILTINIKIPQNPNREQQELWQKLKESEKKKRGWFS